MKVNYDPFIQIKNTSIESEKRVYRILKRTTKY